MIEIDGAWVRRRLPPRKEEGHKGDFGRVLALCGSVPYTGAPFFAAQAAVRTGAGLVFLGVPAGIYPIEAVKCQSAMAFPLPELEGKLSLAALERLRPELAGYDAVLLGCGLGRGGQVEQLVEALLGEIPGPLVLDADGINALQGHIDRLDSRRGAVTILTPHEGEFLRLGGDLTPRREEAALRFARAHGCILLLKGHRTLVAAPDGTLYRNTSGNCGMAKGGSGDILSGMILGLLGQGMPPAEAAAAAAYLHGKAGDLCAARDTVYAMAPEDLLAALGGAFSSVLSES